MLDLNNIYEGDNKNLLSELSAGCVDLTVTSPPYDSLREYEGYIFDFKNTARELFRVTRKGGVLVWVVGDATIDGDETGSSFKQALYLKEIGFKLLDTMIYLKGGQGAVGSIYTYLQDFEYMFVFTKGKIKTFNPIRDRKNVRPETRKAGISRRKKDGTNIMESRVLTTKPHGKRFNVWKYGTHEIKEHPAAFPEQLAYDHILSYSNAGDLVLDPFVGSGTTCIMAKCINRKYIGIEVSSKYCKMAKYALRQQVLSF